MMVVDRLGVDFEMKIVNKESSSRHKCSKIREILSDVVKIIDSNRKSNYNGSNSTKTNIISFYLMFS